MAAATGALNADATSVTTRTALVIQAANRGPRTSTSAVVDIQILLCCTSWRERHGSGRWQGAQRQQQQKQPAVRHRSTARRFVSSCSRRADTSASLPNRDGV